MVPTNAYSYTQLIDSNIMRAMKWITEWKPAWVLSLAGPTYNLHSYAYHFYFILFYFIFIFKYSLLRYKKLHGALAMAETKP